jgi:hypothetical protein
MGMGRSAYSRARRASHTLRRVNTLSDDAHRVFFEQPELLSTFLASLDQMLRPRLSDPPRWAVETAGGPEPAGTRPAS